MPAPGNSIKSPDLFVGRILGIPIYLGPSWFFVALLPEGQRTRDVSTESSEVWWLPAAEAVGMAEAGEGVCQIKIL